jgi:hypothetical protein
MADEPRALLIKCRPEDDFYVAWSDNTESPHWYGTRAEAAAHGYTQDRIARADQNGTSSLPGFYAWGDSGMVAEQRGFLPRRYLRAYVLLYDAGRMQAAFDLLEPFDDGEDREVRRD